MGALDLGLCVPLFAVAYAYAHMAERRASWRKQLSERGPSRLVAGAIATFLIQVVIVSILFGVPWVLGGLARGTWFPHPFSQTDLTAAGALFVYAVIVGLIVPPRLLSEQMIEEVIAEVQRAQREAEALAQDWHHADIGLPLS